MPIYEYKCADCGTKFEKLVRNSSPEVTCPSCGKNHLQQEFSTFAPRAGSGKSADVPMCPSGGPCSNPGMCGLN